MKAVLLAALMALSLTATAKPVDIVEPEPDYGFCWDRRGDVCKLD